MRVAFIHPFLYRYARGIERYTLNLANALTRRGFEVTLLTWRWKEPVQIEKLDPDVKVHRMPTSRYFAATAVIPFYLRDLITNHYDFVWIFFASYGEAEALSLFRRQRFGIVFHYPYQQVPHRYKEFRRFGLVKRAAHIVSVSRFVAVGVREFYGLESTVIQHGVDTNRFAPDPAARACVRSSLNLALDAPLLVTAAALEERKGVQWVLQALPDVLKDFPETTYLILGDGPHRKVLEDQSKELGLESHVRFLGSQEEIARFYQAADVSLILASGEASSLTALESMACGVPVIAARQPPFDELIPIECGVLVKEKDESAVADAIKTLLGEPERRRALGEAGRARIAADFDWKRVGDQYLQLMNMQAFA